MLRISILGAGLVAAPQAALADPVTIAAIGAWATSSAVTQALVQLGISILLSVLAAALAPKPKTPNQKRELQVPNSRPPKRFVYGRNRTYGSPVPWRVKGRILYGCLILNSRPSAGGDIRIYMDKRACFNGGAPSADIFDFDIGVSLEPIEDFDSFSNAEAPRVWIGLGDQVSPPQRILDEVGPGGTLLDPSEDPIFESSDGWQGCTVMWVRLNIGSADQRSERWRSTPPEFEVEMDWSLVWDMRDNLQDPDDPDTWSFSANQALVLLDALRENPIRKYPLSQLHLESFEEAADVADEQVLLYYATLDAGSDVFENRYEANGIVIWNDGELLDQISPIADAGGGQLLRIGGRVGYAAGEYRAPIVTINDFVEDGGIDFQVLKPGRDLPGAVRAVYIAPDRDWQEAELSPINVVGAGTDADNEEATLEFKLPFVTSATQAMRLQQIMARQMALQRSLSVTLWPEAMNVVAGANIEMDLPAGFQRLNGIWQVQSANPAVWSNSMDEDGGGQIALRIPVSLRQINAAVYEWVPATDEQEVLSVEFSPVRPGLGAPTNLTVDTGDGVSTTTQARFEINFDAVAAADSYEVWLRPSGGSYARVLVSADNTGLIVDVADGITYDVKVRSVEGSGSTARFSAFTEVTGVLAETYP